MQTNIENQELLEKVASGDWEAFAALYNTYVPKLYRFIYPFANQNKEDTEEVIQDVFLKVWMRKEKIQGLRSFESYLFKMAKNQLLDQRGRQDSQLRLINKVGNAASKELASVHDQLVYDEYYKIAKGALQGLSPQRRRIFDMRMEEEMSIDEIAEALHISSSAVKKQLYEAINIIKKELRHKTGWPLLCWFMFILS
ncbi:sigma-70 family RNA polymerase sigma factor [Pedobacter gandavensis]|uniref:RNA polymerase sigma factor n=1 Tax=Pedobacter gandavensis TaxID=2679963 RepID=UPI0024790927|nr:sigma-70 family RNA polymerase sigma factor [Pedobacter gandavensis]WGQ12241.1 sigma-70 family RNA polymerase sigma factor [Pedobacter gandavensis]